MKKLTALLFVFLLLSVSFASAETGLNVEFRDVFRLNGRVPDGYTFSLGSQSDLILDGEYASDDPAAPVLEVYIAFNESYAGIAKLDNLGQDGLDLIRQGFITENSVSFDILDTLSVGKLLVTREAGGQFLDFYTICNGYEIELTLLPADGQTLTEEQIRLWTDLMNGLGIQPLA